jgi:hypothetical protein
MEMINCIGPQIDNLCLDTEPEPLATRAGKPPFPVRSSY